MKAKILTTISVLLLTLIVQAQGKIIDVNNNPPENYTPQKGDYIVNNKMRSFEGNYTFVDTNGNKYKMSLVKKKSCFDLTGVCYDRLFGAFEYKKSGKMLIEKKKILNKEELWTNDQNRSLPQITSIGTVNNNGIELRIKDSLKNKSLRGILTKLENGKYSLKISDNIERLIMTEKDKTLPGMTLPSEMILTKIE